MAATKNDLKTVVQILQRASQKGVFQLEQYAIVGALFGKLRSLINVEEGSESKESLEQVDVKMMKELIELCSERGVFKAVELSAVGALYTKLAEAAAEPEVSEMENVE